MSSKGKASKKARKSGSSANEETRKQIAKAGYYRLRLEHTIRFTQQSTRLIYLVNGAVLAMLYFVAGYVEKVSDRFWVRSAAFLLLLILAILNLIHACIIVVQRKWYQGLDIKLANAAGVESKEIVKLQYPSWVPARIATRIGTHRLYALLHLVLAVAAFLAAAAVLLI